MSLRQREDMILWAYIRSIHQENYQSYGRERITEELRDLGISVSQRRVIGWAVSKRLKRDLVMHALQQAITLRKLPKGVIHH